MIQYRTKLECWTYYKFKLNKNSWRVFSLTYGIHVEQKNVQINIIFFINFEAYIIHTKECVYALPDIKIPNLNL